MWAWFISTRLGRWTLAAGLFGLALLGAFLWGAARQKTADRQAALKARLRTVQEVRRIGGDVGKISDDELAARLSRRK